MVDKPYKTWDLRSDLHWLDLTSGKDLWYLGGGAFDNKVFGFTGRPANGHTSFASVADISSDWQATKNVAFNGYYGHGWGKSVVGAIYPTNKNIQLGYVETHLSLGNHVRSSENEVITGLISFRPSLPSLRVTTSVSAPRATVPIPAHASGSMESTEWPSSRFSLIGRPSTMHLPKVPFSMRPKASRTCCSKIRIHVGFAEFLALVCIGDTFVSGFDGSRL